MANTCTAVVDNISGIQVQCGLSYLCTAPRSSCANPWRRRICLHAQGCCRQASKYNQQARVVFTKTGCITTITAQGRLAGLTASLAPAEGAERPAASAAATKRDQLHGAQCTLMES